MKSIRACTDLLQCSLPRPLRTQVLAAAFEAGTKCAHMKQSSHTVPNARLRESSRQLHVSLLEVRAIRVACATMQDTDQIDHNIHASHERVELRIVVNVSLHDGHGRIDQQLAGTGQSPGWHIDPVLGLDESANQVLTNKT